MIVDMYAKIKYFGMDLKLCFVVNVNKWYVRHVPIFEDALSFSND